MNQDNKKILFACAPADGHFYPLTGLAVHLKHLGHDVHWYASSIYKEKIENLGITYHPFSIARDISADKLDYFFPERKKIKNAIKRTCFDMENFFIRRAPEYYQDIKNIYQEFPFDLLMADIAFTGGVFVKEKMNIPLLAIGVLTVTENSKDLPPCGLGMLPSTTHLGKWRDGLLRKLVENILFRSPNKMMHRIMEEHGIDHGNMFVFDMMSKKADVVLQSGTASMEYERSDLSENIKFIGSLLPFRKENDAATWYDERVNQYNKVVLVTQGTVEKDVNKLIIPTLEAFKNTDHLVICTTGGSDTQRLKNLYPQNNIIIEDFIPFGEVMPYADVYVTNGGYGGVMLGIEHELALVLAGLHEGKNEICARMGYHRYGINLKTETPQPWQIFKAVYRVLEDPVYKENITRLCQEFKAYDANSICADYVIKLTNRSNVSRQKARLLADAMQ